MRLSMKEINELKRFFLKLVKVMETNKNYADVLLIKESSLSISKDKSDMNIDNYEDFGVKLRIFDGEMFHVYCATGINKKLLIDKAKALSKLKHKRKIKLDIDRKRLSKHFSSTGKVNPSKINISKKAAFVNGLQKQMLANKKIINARALYMEEKELKIFVNKYKQISQNINSCFLAIVPFVKARGGDVRYYYKSFFSPGYEVIKIKQKDIKEAVNFAISLVSAKKLKPGKYTCILSPDLSGLLAHESFGHGMESDTIYKDRAKAKEYLGKRIASTQVSIIDNPAYPKKNGSFFFDDEGMLTKPTYLIRNGIVKDPITDMYSVSRLKEEGLKIGNKKLSMIKRSGNARAESYDHKCYARMSNTYFASGKTKLKKMMSAVKEGLYLHYSSGGMEDPKGWHVQIQGVVAERIKNGKLTGELFYEAGMTGYLPTILANIKAVGNKLLIPGTGRCGKGHKEWVRVSEGGPHLLITSVELA